MSSFSFLVQQLPFVIPYALVFLVGLVVSLVHLQRYPKPAMLASFGCGVLLCITLLGPVFQALAISQSGSFGWGRVGLLHSVVSIVSVVVHVVGFGLLITAIFADRRLPQAKRKDAPGMTKSDGPSTSPFSSSPPRPMADPLSGNES